MLITSATRSPGMSVETERFFERQLLQDLERRRRHQELLLERRAAAGTGSPRGSFMHRIHRAALAFVAALRDPDPAEVSRRAPVPTHR